jgi:putative tryptophan/tyrosine transport system substrate-binding protein
MQRLRELGYIENRTVAIEYRWTEGRNERYAAMAAELVGLKADIIVALGTPAIVAARKATAIIPIVFPIASDPVGDGLVASLARPGGNVTGLSNQQPELAGKRLEILREVVPGLRQLAVLANGHNPTAILNVGEVQAAAPKLGLEVNTCDVKGADGVPGLQASTRPSSFRPFFKLGGPADWDPNSLAIFLGAPTFGGVYKSMPRPRRCGTWRR